MFNSSLECLEFSAHVDEGHSEVIVSEICDLGPRFILCNLEKKEIE